MSPRRLAAIAIAVLVLGAPAPGQQVSLAEVARLTAQRRALASGPARPYTNGDVLAPGAPAQSAGGTSASTPAPVVSRESQGTSQASSPPVPLATQAPLAAPRAWGRVSFFTNLSRVAQDAGGERSLSEFVTNVTYRSAEAERTGVEFGLDARAAAYGTGGREARLSVYDAWVGASLLGGALRVRGGHLWVNELGGLGAVAGGLVEYRRPIAGARLRVAGFGGLEPLAYEGGYAQGVRRYGAYAAVDTNSLRRHVVGYVLVKAAGLVERSVLSSTNYVPVGRRVFVYQALEYDLQGPGGVDGGGLTYFFTNARAVASRRIDVQATYHRGRSVDTRGIALDQLNGRPVPLRAIEGLLFESLGGRVTATVARGLRVYAGVGRDRNNRDSDPTRRFNAGAYVNDLFGSGVDGTVSLTRIDRGAPGAYESWYVSVGRRAGSRVYLGLDYSSSLSVLRLVGRDGFFVESRPETRRVSGTATTHLGRRWSLLATVERTDDDTSSEWRLLSGLTYRLP